MRCPVRENESSRFQKYFSETEPKHWAARWTLNRFSVLAVIVELPTLATVAQFDELVARLAVPRFSPVRSVFVPPK